MDIQEFSPLTSIEFYNEPLNNFYYENIDIDHTKNDLSDVDDFANEENDSIYKHDLQLVL